MGIISLIFRVLTPGGGAFLRKKYLSAAAVLVVFLTLVQTCILAKAIDPTGMPGYIRPAVLAGVIAILAANAAYEIYLLARKRRLEAGETPEKLYSLALTAYIAGDDAKADELLRAALRLNDLNADMLFLRAQVAARLGNTRRARRLFRKCRSFDEKGKWGWETQTALERL